ncbi:flavin monoamine oxidase family protein [Burkholderia gladioli]|uniref:flavin monoamine oxidase family protein n=1 Tax=Burkholderia gladioli TaxID=28095 RepID=UPI00313301F6
MLRRAQVVIVGAGLAGLTAAWRLEQRGFRDLLLIEAGERLGGRIEAPGEAELLASKAGMAASGAAAQQNARFDLGATWFWPSFQPELSELVEALGLARFAQPEAGAMMVERGQQGAPQRMQAYATGSWRLASSMGALVDAVRARLASTRIVTGAPVRRIRLAGEQVELETIDARGGASVFSAAHVLLALPPRLATTTIEFEPALPEPIARRWRGTATWMAPHAKYLAIYERPFWREAGLSGEARSARGPLAEVHDASAPGGPAALFGFLGVPARTRSRAGDELLRQHCRAQLVRLFGEAAGAPRAEILRDWAGVSTVATLADQDGGEPHGVAPPAAIGEGAWRDRLIGVASEWSPQFPGYVAGAIEAAGLGVTRLAGLLAAGGQTAPRAAAPHPPEENHR